MPRQPKPWLRKSTGTWYVQIKGEKVALGPNRKEAFERFYALMGQAQPTGRASTAVQIIDRFLAWCEKHRPRSLTWYKGFLDHFRARIGAVKVVDLKPYHVTEWLDENDRQPGPVRSAPSSGRSNGPSMRAFWTCRRSSG